MTLLQKAEKQLSCEENTVLNNYCLFSNIKRAQEDKTSCVSLCYNSFFFFSLCLALV